MLYHYSQFLPDDYFDDMPEDDEEDGIAKSMNAISGFFSKIKTSIEETRKTGNISNLLNKSATSKNGSNSNHSSANNLGSSPAQKKEEE